LMYAGHPVDALAALERYKSIDGVLPQFEILCQQHRYSEAFAKMDHQVGEHTSTRWQWDTAKLRVYYEQGDQEKFQKTLAGLAGYDVISVAEITPAQDTVELLVGLDLTEAALPIAAAELAGGATPSEVFGKLFSKAPLAAEIWWRYYRLQNPTEPIRATIARLPALLDKRLAEPNGKTALEAAAKVARVQADVDAERWLQGLAEACQSAGLVEAARSLAKEAAERNNSEAAWLRLGDLYVEAKQYAEAAAAYQQAWQADNTQALPLWLRGWALEKAGQPGGREARDFARAVPLANDDVRVKLADELLKRSAYGPELAAAAFDEQRFVLRLINLWANSGRNAQRMLSSSPRAYTDLLEAAESNQKFLYRLLRTNTYFYKNLSYLVVLHRRTSLQARGLLAKGDVAGAVREAQTALALLPSHSEPITMLVPELAKKGHTAEADQLYATTADALDRLCKDYPQSAEFRNNRAWLAARCRRDLELAVDSARKAVELQPRHTNYRETLAEALFQRGDKAAAIAEINRCIEQEPKNAYYVGQRKRFEAGDKDAPLPER
jgi:tetratricopeptide (TPR) repeat protein